MRNRYMPLLASVRSLRKGDKSLDICTRLSRECRIFSASQLVCLMARSRSSMPLLFPQNWSHRRKRNKSRIVLIFRCVYGFLVLGRRKNKNSSIAEEKMKNKWNWIIGSYLSKQGPLHRRLKWSVYDNLEFLSDVKTLTFLF